MRYDFDILCVLTAKNDITNFKVWLKKKYVQPTRVDKGVY